MFVAERLRRGIWWCGGCAGDQQRCARPHRVSADPDLLVVDLAVNLAHLTVNQLERRKDESYVGGALPLHLERGGGISRLRPESRSESSAVSDEDCVTGGVASRVATSEDVCCGVTTCGVERRE